MQAARGWYDFGMRTPLAIVLIGAAILALMVLVYLDRCQAPATQQVMTTVTTTTPTIAFDAVNAPYNFAVRAGQPLDGGMFGYVRQMSRDDGGRVAIGFDEATLLTGTEAQERAAEEYGCASDVQTSRCDGSEAVLPAGMFASNAFADTTTYALADDARIVVIAEDQTGAAALEQLDAAGFEEFMAWADAEGRLPALWITIREDGKVGTIEELAQP